MKKSLLILLMILAQSLVAAIQPGLGLSWNGASTHLAGAYSFEAFVDYGLSLDSSLGCSLSQYKTRTMIGYNNSPIDDDVLDINVTRINFYYSRIIQNEIVPLTVQGGIGFLTGTAGMDTDNFLSYAKASGYTNSSFKTTVSFSPALFLKASVPVMRSADWDILANLGLSHYVFTPRISYSGDFNGVRKSIVDETANRESVLAWGISVIFKLPEPKIINKIEPEDIVVPEIISTINITQNVQTTIPVTIVTPAELINE